jgi:hypothetical protein
MSIFPDYLIYIYFSGSLTPKRTICIQGYIQLVAYTTTLQNHTCRCKFHDFTLYIFYHLYIFLIFRTYYNAKLIKNVYRVTILFPDKEP